MNAALNLRVIKVVDFLSHIVNEIEVFQGALNLKLGIHGLKTIPEDFCSGIFTN